ncbi:MAG: NAD(P)-dependent oxidoreductase, partial [bacterium]|nr:NAD(P)-dependent oxidoreductase [bacterium]
KKELKMMKETAILINTARGPVVDEAALLDALVNGSIAGAGLDVYECEPHLGCSMYARKLFRKLPNVVVTPHTASATKETRSAMSLVAAKNIIAHLDGKKLPNSV